MIPRYIDEARSMGIRLHADAELRKMNWGGA